MVTFDIVHEVQVHRNDFTQAPSVLILSIPLRIEAIQDSQGPALRSGGALEVGATAISTPKVNFRDFTNATTAINSTIQ